MPPMTGREIEDALAQVEKSLDLYQETGLKQLITDNRQTINQCLEFQQTIIESCDKKRVQLESTKRQLEQHALILAKAESEFAKYRKERFAEGEKELEALLENSLQPEIIHEREKIQELTKKVLNGETPSIPKDVYERVLQVKIYESFALDYEKVKHLNLEQVWQVIEDLWGPVPT